VPRRGIQVASSLCAVIFLVVTADVIIHIIPDPHISGSRQVKGMVAWRKRFHASPNAAVPIEVHPLREVIIQVEFRKIYIAYHFQAVGVEPGGRRCSGSGGEDYRAATAYYQRKQDCHPGEF